MRPYSLVIFFVLTASLLQSCQEKMTCAAFQSYYILDEEARQERFSYFSDSTSPKMTASVRKTDYGLISPSMYLNIVKRNEYKKRSADMRTIPMEVVYPKEHEEDSVFEFDEGDVPKTQRENRYEMDADPDRQLIDTASYYTPKEEKPIVANGNQEKNKYNIDQMSYMWLIGNDILEERQSKIDSVWTDYLDSQNNEKKKFDEGGAFDEVDELGEPMGDAVDEEAAPKKKWWQFWKKSGNKEKKKKEKKKKKSDEEVEEESEAVPFEQEEQVDDDDGFK
ncbi:hypothetical protein [Marinigracilibium pacificum]|uniref:Uncharacterized protein n=1 Tax=Marinigracilibium pacificum TaxID=2729599 RepID=A0A848J0E3_9BACT|nr:hypothetical protein [Marinigracilibium pacificum]NMM49306.1 hypothetical protein [Marinigracilibium pacificum]